jgi:hypothetical protein
VSTQAFSGGQRTCDVPHQPAAGEQGSAAPAHDMSVTTLTTPALLSRNSTGAREHAATQVSSHRWIFFCAVPASDGPPTTLDCAELSLPSGSTLCAAVARHHSIPPERTRRRRSPACGAPNHHATPCASGATSSYPPGPSHLRSPSLGRPGGHATQTSGSPSNHDAPNRIAAGSPLLHGQRTRDDLRTSAVEVSFSCRPTNCEPPRVTAAGSRPPRRPHGVFPPENRRAGAFFLRSHASTATPCDTAAQDSLSMSARLYMLPPPLSRTWPSPSAGRRGVASRADRDTSAHRRPPRLDAPVYHTVVCTLDDPTAAPSSPCAAGAFVSSPTQGDTGTYLPSSARSSNPAAGTPRYSRKAPMCACPRPGTVLRGGPVQVEALSSNVAAHLFLTATQPAPTTHICASRSGNPPRPPGRRRCPDHLCGPGFQHHDRYPMRADDQAPFAPVVARPPRRPTRIDTLYPDAAGPILGQPTILRDVLSDQSSGPYQAVDETPVRLVWARSRCTRSQPPYRRPRGRLCVRSTDFPATQTPPIPLAHASPGHLLRTGPTRPDTPSLYARPDHLSPRLPGDPYVSDTPTCAVAGTILRTGPSLHDAPASFARPDHFCPVPPRRSSPGRYGTATRRRARQIAYQSGSKRAAPHQIFRPAIGFAEIQ